MECARWFIWVREVRCKGDRKCKRLVFTEQKGGRNDGEDGGWAGAEIRDVRAWSGGMDLALTQRYKEPPAGFELSDQVSALATLLTADGRWAGQGPRDSWVLLQESR